MKIPHTVPETYRIDKSKRFSFHLRFVWNSTRSPAPAPTKSPDIIVPKLMNSFKYNCVITTEEAQFGMSPTIPARTGPNNGWLDIKAARRSSPIRATNTFKTIVNKRINRKIFPV